jgi:hypothetical protein
MRLLQELTHLSVLRSEEGTRFSAHAVVTSAVAADPLTVAEPEIANIGARMTMVGGKIVHETPDWSG